MSEAAKPNCYDCKWRGQVAWSAHSECNHPALSGKTKILTLVSPGIAAHVLGVTGDAHGRKRGWFNWPLDFDPVWLESCNGFERK